MLITLRFNYTAENPDIMIPVMAILAVGLGLFDVQGFSKLALDKIKQNMLYCCCNNRAVGDKNDQNGLHDL